MILQALSSYYERLAADESPGIAQEGFAEQPVDFALELSEEGELVNVYDIRTPTAKGKKMERRRMVLPSLGESKGSGIKPNFLWENASYVLGRDDKGKPKRTKDCQTSFYDLHKKLLANIQDKEAKSLLKFLENPEPDHPKITENWKDLSKGNLVFRLRGETEYFHQNRNLCQCWSAYRKETEAWAGVCLATGEKGRIAKLHPPIKCIVGDGAKAEMSLCSYNEEAFCSFGKDQNLNGPVGVKTAFNYVAALNYLLRRPTQCVRLGNVNVVAWAEGPSPLEGEALGLFEEPEPGEKTADPISAQIRLDVLRKLLRGIPLIEAWPELEPGVKIHLLGLTPNSARLSVSFYLTDSAGDFMEKVRDWYANLSIQKTYDWEKDFPSVYEIAKAALGLHKAPKDIDRLGKDLFQSALTGGPYPAYFLPMCLSRLRSGDKFLAVHAALIKAMLIRNFKKEVSMSLNTNHPSPAYQLGRLFAILVRVQRKAIGQNINAGIKDKYFGSASATPSLVFPLLLRSAQNHISKVQAYGYDKMIGEVLNKINDAFPNNLSLEDQGLFALGYYHQQADKKVEEIDKDIETQGVEE